MTPTPHEALSALVRDLQADQALLRDYVAEHGSDLHPAGAADLTELSARPLSDYAIDYRIEAIAGKPLTSTERRRWKAAIDRLTRDGYVQRLNLHTLRLTPEGEALLEASQ